MHVIGITGGVGVGKSSVLAYLQQKYDAQVIQADLVAKELQQKGQQVFMDIAAAFGSTILDEEGSLDRSALAEIVFQDEAQLKLLNGIVHPAVRKKISEEIERLAQCECENSSNLFLFIEAALLLEAHYDEICEEIWYIYAQDEVRRQRLKASRGYTDEKISHMFANQKTREEFSKACGVIIDNSGGFADTSAQIDREMQRVSGHSRMA